MVVLEPEGQEVDGEVDDALAMVMAMVTVNPTPNMSRHHREDQPRGYWRKVVQGRHSSRRGR